MGRGFVCGDGKCHWAEKYLCPPDCIPKKANRNTEPSCGCTSSSTVPSGKRCGGGGGAGSVFDLVIDGLPTTKYGVYLPNNYGRGSSATPVPLLIYLHGWTGDLTSIPDAVVDHAQTNGYMVVAPTGFENSWNGARTAHLRNCPAEDHYSNYSEEDCDVGEGTSTCAKEDDDYDYEYCFDSCKDILGDCPTENSNSWGYDGTYTCYWTTCYDSTAQIVALLDELEQRYCVDRNMIWVTGCSNGGMMVHELAKDPRTNQRFAGFLPQVGGPPAGFQLQHEDRSASTTLRGSDSTGPSKFYMGFWGKKDNTVPGLADFPKNGPQFALDTSGRYLYTAADDMGEMWASLTGATKQDGYDFSEYSGAGNLKSKLESCDTWQSGTDGADSEIVTCFFTGGHICPGFDKQEEMMWDFALKHPNNVDSTACPA